jgi:hypothetical protein
MKYQISDHKNSRRKCRIYFKAFDEITFQQLYQCPLHATAGTFNAEILLVKTRQHISLKPTDQ